MAAVLTACLRRREGLATHGVDLLLLGQASMLHGIRSALAEPVGVAMVDCDAAFLERCGAGTERPLVLVLDRGLRVAARLEMDDPERVAAAALLCIEALPVEAARDVSLPAPVLMLPGLLDAAFCRELIETFEGKRGFDSGFSSMDAAGNPVSKIDHAKKQRRDCLIEPGSALHVRFLDVLARRCLPEIKKAFQFDVTHTDRILIARYDEPGGHFRRHRDNSGKNVAFRQFAISVNLNAEAYDGGHLLFPEFNAHRYRPATGAAVVFSASLLHEVAPVTRGQRYVLLTFLHGEEAEARRQAYLAHTSQAP
ncbi:MAG: 2OG-Fe(II) oxygenase [Janthinobacterium lividum]